MIVSKKGISIGYQNYLDVSWDDVARGPLTKVLCGATKESRLRPCGSSGPRLMERA